MHSPELVAGYPSGCAVDKDANPETTLGSAYSPVDYMSITSFPRLPEDDMQSGDNTLKSRKDDDNVLSEQDTGEPAWSDPVTLNSCACIGSHVQIYGDFRTICSVLLFSSRMNAEKYV